MFHFWSNRGGLKFYQVGLLGLANLIFSLLSERLVITRSGEGVPWGALGLSAHTLSAHMPTSDVCICVSILGDNNQHDDNQEMIITV